MTGSVLQRFYDHSKENFNVQVHTPDLTGDITAALVAITALRAAIRNVTLGTEQSFEVKASSGVGVESGVFPPESQAQKEYRWIVRYTDDVNGHSYHFTIPAPNTALIVPFTDLMDITAGDGLTLKNAIEAIAVSPYGNAVTVTEIALAD